MKRKKKEEERGEEMPHLCWIVGRSSNVREVLGLASSLGVNKFEAIGYVVVWEEIVFHGNASGRVPGLRMKDLAAALGWRKDLKVLERGMKESGLLEKRGQVLCHPYWPRSRTGQYMRTRKETRLYWREFKAEKRRLAKEAAAATAAAQLAASGQGTAAATAAAGGGTVLKLVHEMSNGHPVDVRRTSRGVHQESRHNKVINKGTSEAGSPPGPPPEAGGEGCARWEIVEKLHPRPIKTGACEPALAAYTADEWVLCEWVLVNREARGLSSISRKKTAFTNKACDFVTKKLWQQFRPEFLRKEAPPPSSVAPEIERAQQEKQELADREWKKNELLKFLSDETLSPEKKAYKKRTWLGANPWAAEWLEGQKL